MHSTFGLRSARLTFFTFQCLLSCILVPSHSLAAANHIAETQISLSSPKSPEKHLFDINEFSDHLLEIFSTKKTFPRREDVEKALKIKLKPVDRKKLVNSRELGEIYVSDPQVDAVFDIYYWDISKDRFGLSLELRKNHINNSGKSECIYGSEFSARLVDAGWTGQEITLKEGAVDARYEKGEWKLSAAYSGGDKCLTSITSFGKKGK